MLNETPQKTSVDSFETFIEPHMDYLYHLAYQITAKKSASEDLVQEVLFNVLKQWEMVANLANPRVWLSSEVHHTQLDIRRRRSNSPAANIVRDSDLDVNQVAEEVISLLTET